MIMKEQNFDTFSNAKPKPLVVFEFGNHSENITFTQEDLEKAETKAEAKGYTKGFNEGMELGLTQGELRTNRELDAMTQEILAQLDSSLKEITALEKSFSEHFFPNILKVCSMVLQKTMPYFFQKQGEEEMKNILHEVIESLIVKVPIQVKVSEQLYENIVENLRSLRSSYPETIDVIKIPEFSKNACEINWEGGSAKWNLDSRYEEIHSKLQKHLKVNAEEGENHG